MAYIVHIEQATRENSYFRKVLHTGKHSQLVLMSLKPGESIGEEKHTVDQFIRIEEGFGKVILDGRETSLAAEDAVVIPAGTKHNVVNTGKKELKLYTIYSPPNHIDGRIHKTKADAELDEEDEAFGHSR
ncbi:MAG: cupin domain-containing protein [bacterium]|nr:cupin domain-containing protein [bacterium]